MKQVKLCHHKMEVKIQKAPSAVYLAMSQHRYGNILKQKYTLVLLTLHRNNNWIFFLSLWNMDILKLLLFLIWFGNICLYFLNIFPAMSPPDYFILEIVCVHAWISVHVWITKPHLLVQNCPNLNFESHLTLTDTWTNILK